MNGVALALLTDEAGASKTNVTNPERRERSNRPESQRSPGRRRLTRIEKADPLGARRPADSFGIGRANAGGSGDRQVSGAMRFGRNRASKLLGLYLRMDSKTKRWQVIKQTRNALTL